MMILSLSVGYPLSQSVGSPANAGRYSAFRLVPTGRLRKKSAQRKSIGVPHGAPFIPAKRGKEKVEEKKNSSALVTGQYEFLVTQLEKVLKNYFGLSARIKEMHAEIFSLKTELAKALPISGHAMTAAKDCLKRVCDVISLFSSNRLG